MHTCNLSSLEAESGGCRVFKASLGYIGRHRLKMSKKPKLSKTQKEIEEVALRETGQGKITELGSCRQLLRGGEEVLGNCWAEPGGNREFKCHGNNNFSPGSAQVDWDFSEVNVPNHRGEVPLFTWWWPSRAWGSFLTHQCGSCSKSRKTAPIIKPLVFILFPKCC